MSKFYWSLKGKGAFKKYQIMYVVTHLNHRRAKPYSGGLRTYPSNKWGYGYYINKHKRQHKNERSPLLQQWYANLESKTK